MTPQARPTFTVVIAAYNAGDKLRLTAESILGQPADLELLIVDAASTDGSLEDAARLVASDRKRVRLISERDAGVYDAMNKGVLASRGRFLLFMGAGDVLQPGALAEVAKALPPDGDDGMVYGDALLDGRRYDGPFDKQKLIVRNVCHQAAFYGRKLFDRHGLYDLRYRLLADYAFNLRVFGDARRPPRWVDVVVSSYEGGGMSVQQDDAAFTADREALLRKHFGSRWYLKHRWPLVRERIGDAVGPAGRALLGRRRPK